MGECPGLRSSSEEYPIVSEVSDGLRPASTVVLCRDGEEGLEVLMVKRHHQIDFASGAIVFPGGKVSAADADVPGGAGMAAADIPYYVAAIREAFEECGILLADDASGNVLSAERAAALGVHRLAVERGELRLADLLASEGLRPAFERLVPFAHWITPGFMPKRFDTRFYIAEAPPAQVALHDGVEAVDTIWVTPADALAGGDDGRFTIIYPTRRNLELLAQSATAGEAIAGARARTIERIEPWVEDVDGVPHLVISDTCGYPVTREVFSLPK